MVEFKRSVDGRLHLIELNPKLWGSLDLSIAVGMNVPVRIGEMATNSNLIAQTEFKRNFVFWWPLDSLTSVFRPPAHPNQKLKTNVEIADILPSLNMFLQLVYVTLFSKVGGGLLGRLRHWINELGVARALLRFWNEVAGIPTKVDSKLNENLWIGAKPSWLGLWILNRVHGLVPYTLLEDIREGDTSRPNRHGTHVPEHVEISDDAFKRVVDDLNSLIHGGKSVFLHCREGVGRAPSLAIAYLISNGSPLDSATSLVKERRSITKLSRLQQDSIARFAKRMRKS
jgi:dual specificity MAP kinase phosphatase